VREHAGGVAGLEALPGMLDDWAQLADQLGRGRLRPPAPPGASVAGIPPTRDISAMT